MIAQQELQNLLALPEQEKLRLMQYLLESLVARVNHQLSTTETQNSAAQTPAPAEAPSPSAQAWLSMAGIYAGPSNTGERADEICRAEIKQRSGFMLKEELHD